MKDIDELKSKWQNIIPPQHQAGDSRNTGIPTADKAPRTIKDRLISRLRRIYLAIAGGLLLIPALARELDAPAEFLAFYAAYFLLGGILNLIQIQSLRKADFATMTTLESIGFVTAFTRRRKQFRLTLIALATLLLAVFFLIVLRQNDALLIVAMACGTVIGLVIGLRINSRFNADLRLLRSYLGDN